MPNLAGLTTCLFWVLCRGDFGVWVRFRQNSCSWKGGFSSCPRVSGERSEPGFFCAAGAKIFVFQYRISNVFTLISAFFCGAVVEVSRPPHDPAPQQATRCPPALGSLGLASLSSRRYQFASWLLPVRDGRNTGKRPHPHNRRDGNHCAPREH